MDYSPSYWAKIGRTFFSGENKSGDFVTDAEYTDCVSMNNDGTIIALGSGITTAGLISRVRVFEWNTTSNDWTQKGQHLHGSSTELFGAKIKLNKLGNKLAITSHKGQLDGELVNSGYVSVYQWNSSGSTWDLMGNHIAGGVRATNGYFGWGVIDFDLSGNKIAIGQMDQNIILATNNDNGYIWTFDWDGNDWISSGYAYGRNTDQHLGGSICLSDDGTILVGGGPTLIVDSCLCRKTGWFIFNQTDTIMEKHGHYLIHLKVNPLQMVVPQKVVLETICYRIK